MAREPRGCVEAHPTTPPTQTRPLPDAAHSGHLARMVGSVGCPKGEAAGRISRSSFTMKTAPLFDVILLYFSVQGVSSDTKLG